MKLSLGKLPPEVLRRYILRMTGASSKDLVLPPSFGLDFGVVRLRDGFLIVSSDPVTGVVSNIGWHAVVVSANDVSTSGSRPQFMQSVILLPERADEESVREVSSQIAGAARRLRISIVGGHTELTPGLARPILVTTAFALADSFITAAGAEAGDTMMLTKSAGIEGTAILAGEAAKRGMDSGIARRSSMFMERMSVVDEAEKAFSTGFVHAMHDCTEGGVIGAIYEMSVASGTGFEAYERKIPVAKETMAVCSTLGVDALRLIGSGALVLAVANGREEAVRKALQAIGVPATPIGKFVEGRRVLTREGGRRTLIRTSPTDELWKIEKSGHLVST